MSQTKLLQRDALADVFTDLLDLVVRQRQLVELGHAREFLPDGRHAVGGEHDGVEPRHAGERLHGLDAIFVGDERAEVGHAVDSLKGLELVTADVEDAHVRHATRLASHRLAPLLLLSALLLVGALVLTAAAADLPRLSLRARRQPRAAQAAVGQAEPLELHALGDGGDGPSVRHHVIAQVELAEARAPRRDRRVDARHAPPLQVERGAAAVLERERGIEHRHGVCVWTDAPADTLNASVSVRRSRAVGLPPTR